MTITNLIDNLVAKSAGFKKDIYFNKLTKEPVFDIDWNFLGELIEKYRISFQNYNDIWRCFVEYPEFLDANSKDLKKAIKYLIIKRNKNFLRKNENENY